MKRTLYIALTFLALTLFAIPQRGIESAKILSFSDDSAPTVSDYVQDGLVAIWDGIDNAGVGEHADNGSIVDLVSGRASSISAVFEDNCFLTDETKVYILYFDTPLDSTSPFTAEICCEVEDDGRGIDGRVTRILFGRSIYAELAFGWYAYSSSSTLNLQTSTGFRWSMETPSPFGKATYGAASSDGESPEAYFIRNGQKTLAGRGFLNWNFGGIVRVGKVASTPTGFRGRCFNVRIYNRVLDDWEVYHNHLIDRLRFNLP